jgi:hypothetical protein
MTTREIQVPAGNRRVIEFTTTYSENWSVPLKRETGIMADDVSTVAFLLKRKMNNADEAADVEKTLGDGIAVTDGKVTVTLDATDTKDLQGKYFGTLRLHLTDGGVVDWIDEDFADTPYIMLDFTQGAVEAVA